MRADDQAIGGFFEDLPVLAFVLAGTATIVLSGALASEQAAETVAHTNLDSLAERLLDSVMVRLSAVDSMDRISITSVESVNISRSAAEILGEEEFAYVFVEHHPCLQWLRAGSSSCRTPPANTGHSSCLFNAYFTNGLVGIVEVNLFVWR